MKGNALAGRESAQPLTSRTWRLFWLVVLVAHIFLAVGWWWLEPGGFELGHPRFWSNTVAAPVGLLITVVALLAMHAERMRMLRWLLPVWPSGWAASAIAGRVLFPITLAPLWLVPLGGAVAMGIGAGLPWRGAGGRGWIGAVASALCAAVAGAALVLAQRPPSPNTHPQGASIATRGAALESKASPSSGSMRIHPRAMVHATDGTVTVHLDSLSLTIQPLMTFLSGSKDGCWSILARLSDRSGPEPRLRRAVSDGQRSCVFEYDFPGQGPAELRARADAATGAITIDATTVLEQVVYSHLNSYCDIEVRGQHRLALEFSPCPGLPIEVTRYDYPVGRPARFAFVQQDRTFRVVEASTGEKGPFRTLARGHLGLAESLKITLFDQAHAVGSVTLADWSSQADTTLSPTAGWGVPVNAIEFSLSTDAPTSPASIFVTLAGTSVGRGWDCVGHKPGSYRNRIDCKAIVGDSQPSNPSTAGRKD
jgi:hypothetical protein